MTGIPVAEHTGDGQRGRVGIPDIRRVDIDLENVGFVFARIQIIRCVDEELHRILIPEFHAVLSGDDILIRHPHGDVQVVGIGGHCKGEGSILGRVTGE